MLPSCSMLSSPPAEGAGEIVEFSAAKATVITKTDAQQQAALIMAV